MKEKRLITAALPYTNNVPHIGNIVGSHLPADIFARYCRARGYDTVFVGGTDDNGTTSEIAAQQHGVSFEKLCTFFYNIHKHIYDWFQISYDNFSRTSKPIHHETVKEFFLKLYAHGYLLEKNVHIPFCTSCQRSLADRYIQGTCPYCAYEFARGDQCEHCGKLLEPDQLKKPSCSVCKKETIAFQQKKHLFLDLAKSSKHLEKWIKSQKHWRKQVTHMALSWIDNGLKPRDITRELKSGVPFPIKGYEDKKIYVWAEAAIGYISSTKEWNNDKWQDYWKNKDCKIYNFIGKDNIPFHTIVFPAELLAEGTYTLPYNVVGLQYLNYERSKFSKSKGHGVFCENLPNIDRGVDYWRFYLSFCIPETGDTEFLWKEFQDRINNDLIANFGNFINRTLTFIWKNYKGTITGEEDKEFTGHIKTKVTDILHSYEHIELRDALRKILELSTIGNKYLNDKEPWKTGDKNSLYNCSHLCKILALLIQPYLPVTSKTILSYLNCPEKDWRKLLAYTITKINEPHILFDKLEDAKIEDLKKKTSKITEFKIE